MGELNYVEYDFDSLVLQLQDFLKAKNAWKDVYRSSTGQTLIEVFAYAVTVLLYYLERRVEELYLPTAKLYSSVVSLVGLIGYTPKRKVSAAGYAKFSISSPYSKSIYISKFTRLRVSGGPKFVVIEDGVILPGQTETTVSVVQGEKVEFTVTSDGSVDQKVRINDLSVENEKLWVYVDGELWAKVQAFIGYDSGAKVYVVRNELNGTTSILFGDGKFGKVPPALSVILVRYIKTDGLKGNIYSSGLLNTIEDRIYDSDGNVISNISVTNESPILGGDDEEDIEEVRVEAPRVFRTGERGVTKEDYETILRNYAGVVGVKVWGEYEENYPNIEMRNSVKMCILLQNWAIPSPDFKVNLQKYLQKYKVITTRHVFEDPIVVEVVPYINAKAFGGYGLQIVKNNIVSKLEEMFALSWDTVGKSCRQSDFIRIVDEAEGVNYHYSYLRAREMLGTGDGAKTVF